jgi:hypothetical protein
MAHKRWVHLTLHLDGLGEVGCTADIAPLSHMHTSTLQLLQVMPTSIDTFAACILSWPAHRPAPPIHMRWVQ